MLLFHTIARRLWETVAYESGDSIPVLLKHSRDGCIAELSIDPPRWDDEGRLEGTVFVYYFKPTASEFEKMDAFLKARKFPIFYSVVSGLEMFGERIGHIMCEFSATPFSSLEQCKIDDRGPLPSLEVPPGHETYEPKGHLKARVVQRGYVPTENDERAEMTGD